MNNILNTEYLYDIFSYANESRVDISSFFRALFGNQDFRNMINAKPFDISNVLKIVDVGEKTNRHLSKNQIRYLSFLVAEFLDRTMVSMTDIPKYVDVSDIFDRFDSYHSQDVDDVIFSLMTKKNQTYRLRKSTKEAFLKEDLLKRNFLKLYPMRKYDSFDAVFDAKTFTKLYQAEGNVLFLSKDLEALFGNEYFIHRYCAGNKIFCFTDKNIKLRYKSSLYLFVIGEEKITLAEPNGTETDFLFSN